MIFADQIKEQYGSEVTLLLLCCRVFLKTEKPAVLSEFIQKNSLDLSAVYELAKVHRIRPLVYETLNGIDSLSSSLKTELKQFFVKQSLHAFQCNQKADQMVSLLKRHQLSVQLYKGIHLSRLLYNHLSIREFGDIDFIINKEDVVRLVETLKTNGYTIEGEELFAKSPNKYIKEQKDILCRAETPEGTFLYEFHFKPIAAYLSLNTSFKDLLPDNWQIGTDFSACDYTSLLTINHGLVDLYPNLRYLVDIGRLLQLCTFKNVKLHPELAGFYKLNAHLASEVLGVENNTLPMTANEKQVKLLGEKIVQRLFKKTISGRVSTSAILQASLLLRKGVAAKTKLMKAILKYIITPNYNDAPESDFKYKWMHTLSRPFRLLQHFKRHV